MVVVSCVTSCMLSLDVVLSEAIHQCAAAVRVVGLELDAVVGIAFAAFAIGILLTGSLWLIHSRTGMLYIL